MPCPAPRQGHRSHPFSLSHLLSHPDVAGQRAPVVERVAVPDVGALRGGPGIGAISGAALPQHIETATNPFPYETSDQL